jgi:Ca-activated chloride channel family protein
MKIEWGAPQNFFWLWVLPAMAAVFWLSSWRRKRRVQKIGEQALVERLMSSLSFSKRLAKRLLLILAVLLMIVALGQPHFRTKETEVERKGVDVIIAVDVSLSMLAKDITPSRLEKAKLELSGLVDRLKGDRIGVVAFAGDAVIQCPLTFDRNAVKLFLTTIGPNLIPLQGTAIGKALQTSEQAFMNAEKGYKVIILLTDGEDHEGNPLEAAKKSKEAGTRIFTIGIGTSDGGTLPGDVGNNFKKDRQGRIVLSKLNDSLLRDIASQTGGVYYRSAKGVVEADAIAREIKKMSQKGYKKDLIIEYEENYQYFLIAAFILLLIQMAISERKRTADSV